MAMPLHWSEDIQTRCQCGCFLLGGLLKMVHWPMEDKVHTHNIFSIYTNFVIWILFNLMHSLPVNFCIVICYYQVYWIPLHCLQSVSTWSQHKTKGVMVHGDRTMIQLIQNHVLNMLTNNSPYVNCCSLNIFYLTFNWSLKKKMQLCAPIYNTLKYISNFRATFKVN